MFAAAHPRWQAEGRGVVRGLDAVVQYLRDLDFELRALGHAHHVITMSPEDAERLRSFVPDARLSVSPCGVDCEEFRPPARPPPADVDVLFVGHFGHPPNVDAVRFLADAVLPRLRHPLRVRVVGRDVSPALARRTGIEFMGPVPDVRPHLAAARVVVAPVRFGTGMRGKVLEALAMGRPVVATRLGTEGLGVTPGRHCLVADDADGFAGALERVLADDALAATLGAEGRRLVASRFDWDVIAAAHEELYETVLRDPVRPAAIPAGGADALERIGRHLGRWPAFAIGVGLLGVRALRWHAGRRSPARPAVGGSLLAAGEDAATP
jgi:glycosyltransferase involved in cell wall biosynthesis